jgi:hypothetical protein
LISAAWQTDDRNINIVAPASVICFALKNLNLIIASPLESSISAKYYVITGKIVNPKREGL